MFHLFWAWLDVQSQYKIQLWFDHGHRLTTDIKLARCASRSPPPLLPLFTFICIAFRNKQHFAFNVFFFCLASLELKPQKRWWVEGESLFCCSCCSAGKELRRPVCRTARRWLRLSVAFLSHLLLFLFSHSLYSLSYARRPKIVICSASNSRTSPNGGRDSKLPRRSMFVVVVVVVAGLLHRYGTPEQPKGTTLKSTTGVIVF